MPDGVLGFFVGAHGAGASHRTLARTSRRAATRVARDSGEPLLVAQRRAQGVSRRAGARRREPDGARRRDPRASRTQRLGQVDVHQRRQRTLPCRRRIDPLRRPGDRGMGRAPHRARRHRAHVPDSAAVRASHRARQRRAARDVRRRGARRARRRAAKAQRWLEFTGLAPYAQALPERPQSSPAQVPGARARARVAAATRAPRRGAVGPHARRDQRRRRPHPRDPRAAAPPSCSSST